MHYSESSQFSKLNIQGFVTSSDFEVLQDPVELENAWEIDAPHDNSCLFWAAALGYLMPVVSDDFSFKNRYIKLFGEKALEKLNLIRNLLKNYNPFSNVNPLKNQELNHLIREQFRSRIIEYIVINAENFRQYWEDQGNPNERSFEDYLSWMHDPDSWGGELEIKAINELLGCRIQVIANGNVRNYDSENIEEIILVHVNVAGNEAVLGNHYRFRLGKALGNAYKAEIANTGSQSNENAKLKDQELEHLKKRVDDQSVDTALSYLLKKYQCEKRSEILLKSTEKGDLQDVKTILKIGVDVNAVSEKTFQTALHIAVLKKAQEIAVLLLRHGANPNLLDSNDKTAPMYAAESQVEFYELKKMALSDAFALRDFFRVSDLMAQLASDQLSNNEYIAAALLLNGALAAIEKKSEDFCDTPEFKDKLITQLKSIEPALIKHLLKDPNYEYRPANDQSYGINPEHKEFLDIIRLNVKALFEEINLITALPDEPTSVQIQELYQFISSQISELLEKILQDCIGLLPGQPPCGYALIGTGSLARGEITPYSDIECFLLIEEATPENLRYFSNLSLLLQLKIINLGESDLTKGYKLLPLTVQNPTSKGFSLDVHKNPTNKEQPLIGTPQQIARYQRGQHYIQESNNHFSGAFINLRYITGTNTSLLPSLQRAMGEIYDEESSNVNSLRLTRSLAMLKEDVSHFEPKSDQMSEGHLLEAKEDFYRLLQTFMDSLSLYKNLESCSTWDRIKELERKGFFNQSGCLHLLQLHGIALWFRLRTYIHYGRHEENIDVFFSVTSHDTPFASPLFGIQKADLNILSEMYKVLMPLHECMLVFHNSKGTRNLFPSNVFYDESAMTAGKIAARLCQYSEAEKFFEAALENAVREEDAPNILTAAKELAHVARKLGNFSKAAHYLEVTLEVYYNSTFPVHPIEMARVLTALANTTPATVALPFAEEALRIVSSFSGSQDLKVAIMKNNLSKVLLKLGKYKQALDEIQGAIDIQEKLRGADYEELSNSYNARGFAYQDLGQYQKAFPAYHEALRIAYLHYGLKHPRSASIFVNLASLNRAVGDNSKSLKFYNLALNSQIAIFGENHPEVANIYNNLGGVSIEMGDLEFAKECFQKVSDIYQCHDAKEPLTLATHYCNWGSLYYQKGDADNAEKYYKLALDAFNKSHSENHFKKKYIINNLAMLMLRLKKYDAALKLFEEALSIVRENFGENNINAVTIIHNQGLVYRELQSFDEAYACFDKALKIMNATFSFPHPTKEIILTSYAETLNLAGLSSPAVNMYKKALDMTCDTYGETSPEFIAKLLGFNLQGLLFSYYHIGRNYYDLKNLDLAKSFFEKALDLSYGVLGSQHPITALIFYHLGLTLIEINTDLSQKAFLNALRIAIVYKDNHPIFLQVFGNLKATVTGQDIYLFEPKEKPIIQESATKVQSSLKYSMDKLSGKLSAIAIGYHNLQNYNNALYYHQQSLDVHCQLVGHEDLDSVITYCEMAEIWKDLAKPEKVREYFVTALGIALNFLEDTDPLIIRIASNLDPETLSQMGIQIVPIPIIFPEDYPMGPNYTPPLIFSTSPPNNSEQAQNKGSGPNQRQGNK